MKLTANKQIVIEAKYNDACDYSECKFCITEEDHITRCALFDVELDEIIINDLPHEKRLQQCKDEFGLISED